MCAMLSSLSSDPPGRRRGPRVRRSASRIQCKSAFELSDEGFRADRGRGVRLDPLLIGQIALESRVELALTGRKTRKSGFHDLLSDLGGNQFVRLLLDLRGPAHFPVDDRPTPVHFGTTVLRDLLDDRA